MSFSILFIAQDDPFYVRIFFDEFLKAYEGLNEIKGVVVTRPMGKRSRFSLMRQMWGFYGPLAFVKVGTKYCALETMGALQKLLNRPGRIGLAQLCRSYGVDAFYEDDINGRPFLERLRGMELDLIISVAASAIFKEDLLRLPKHGCVNIHNAKLPKYRGMMPVFWQLYHDEQKIGITVHEMNVKIDDGRILLQKEIAIEPGESLDSLMRRMKKVAAHMVIEFIDQVKSGNVKYKENPASESSYFTFPSRKDVKEFKKKGKRIL